MENREITIHASEQTEGSITEFMEFFTPFIDNIPVDHKPEILEAIANTCRAMGGDASDEEEPAKFGGYLRDGYIPHGLFKAFGYGSLLFYPANSGNYRNRFPYPSAAKAFFKKIRTADHDGFINQICSYLDKVIVRIVREEQKFLFQQDALAGLPMDSSLIDMIRCLENGVPED